MFHTWNISNSSSLSMYHRLRTMAGTTEDPELAAAVDVCVNAAENMTTEELSWTQDPGTWMASQEVAGFNSTLATMNTKLDMLIAERDHSNGPKPNG